MNNFDDDLDIVFNHWPLSFLFLGVAQTLR